MSRRLWTVTFLGFASTGLGADTLYVGPGEAFTTIQAAVDWTVNGDTVVVRDGTYTGGGNRDIDFRGKAITVCSENGPATCIIDCEQLGRAFYFHTGETSSAVVSGFTIRNGSAESGGGI